MGHTECQGHNDPFLTPNSTLHRRLRCTYYAWRERNLPLKEYPSDNFIFLQKQAFNPVEKHDNTPIILQIWNESKVNNVLCILEFPSLS